MKPNKYRSEKRRKEIEKKKKKEEKQKKKAERHGDGIDEGVTIDVSPEDVSPDEMDGDVAAEEEETTSPGGE